MIKSGFSEDSPFYHSFGAFIQHDFQRFDTEVKDFPVDLEYQDIQSAI